MIKSLTENDRQEYIQLATEFYNTDAVIKPIPRENFEKTFDEMMQSSIYAEGFLFQKDNEAAGYALLAKTFSQEAGGLVIWIEEIYVRPKFRSQGLGKEFFEFLYKERPAIRYRLETEHDNKRANKLYKSLGFVDFPYEQMVRE
jgi:ribosomal protein S18 acetylase RimI-like enzyme